MESFKSECKEFGSFYTKTNGDTENISQKRLCKQNKQTKTNAYKRATNR